MTTAAIRLSGWSLLVAGVGAGVVLPHPVTTALWTLSAKLFGRVGDQGMVRRLTAATKFGPRIRERLSRSSSRRFSRALEAF